MKKICSIILLAFFSIVYGYGQATFREKVVVVRVEDTEGILDRSGVTMLQSAIVDAFSKLQNVGVVDCSGISPSQGNTFQLYEIIDIGKRVFADIVIVPSVTKINGNEIILAAKIVNVETWMMDAGVNVKCNIRDKKEQSSIFRNSCADLSEGLSNRIRVKQMENITFSQGKLCRDGMKLNESEIKFFLGYRYDEWKNAKAEAFARSRQLIAGSVVISFGGGLLIGGGVGLSATEGWPDDDLYRALSIGGVVVGVITTLLGPFIFVGMPSKADGLGRMEDVFLKRKAGEDYRVELNFGAQRYGVGFALKF